MNWEISKSGGVDLSVDREEFAIIAVCLSRLKHVLTSEQLEQALKMSRDELDALSWNMSMAQGDYHRKFGGGPQVELS
ncbi:hypothetical protein [Actinomadura sp. HBU206391]|uniref:hypothetical protein n=1 Tax=Actinomadura sp. HBU206391 TaxID=2731692 RepID=UPI00165043BC|nr:hypothetical protein [Actinomadura sp. HBU206391]MBC6456731.1 hypothetical protein [Actinomadura sp. HBU206391]